ncbi:MAG: type II secretion system F family protein, partial [Gammaproteobacteria bacterium]|nr:type II secretion system F family protein [Gammaproteobacteria bacterium]
MPIEITSSSGAVKAASGKGQRASGGSLQLFAKKPGTQERIFFTEQLSLLLETGTSMHVALQALKKQVTNPGLVRIIDGLIEQINEGNSLSAALAHYPDMFPSTYVNLVGAAEDGGFLDKVLLELMNMDEKREELRRTVTSSLSYPTFLILFSLGVVLFVLVVVFPKFADMFASIKDELPGTTLFLMGASGLLIEHWMTLSAGLVVGLAGIAWWLHTPGGSIMVDRFKMGTIGIRDIYIQLYLIQSLRVLGLSLSNGVSIPDALASCRDVVHNSVFRRFISDVQTRVTEGSGFAMAFQQADFIPPTVRQMVTTGDETGNLPR